MVGLLYQDYCYISIERRRKNQNLRFYVNYGIILVMQIAIRRIYKGGKHFMFYVSNSILAEIERNLIEMADLYAILVDINLESSFQINLEPDSFLTDALDSDEYPFLSCYV